MTDRVDFGAAVLAFGYDDANRKIWEDQTEAGMPTRRVQTNVNPDGQRTNLTVGSTYILNFEYTERNELKTIRDSNMALFSYTYDLNGNMTKRQDLRGGVNNSTNVLYDELNRPTTWEQVGAGDDPFARDGNNNFSAWNVYGAGPDEILCRYSTAYPQRLRYHGDRMGNIHTLFNDSGVIIERYTYDAFGKATVTNGDGSGPRGQSLYGNRFMFTGREWLAPRGLYDYRNRFYHPGLGRFLQPDPIGFAAGDTNLFRYCAGDPVNYVDPSGLQAKEPPKKKYEPRGHVLPNGNFVDTRSYDPTSVLAPGLGGWYVYDPGSGDRQYGSHAGDRFGGAPGEGSGSDGGTGSGANSRVIRNPYLESNPILAELAQGFDSQLLEQTATAYEVGATIYVAGTAIAMFAAEAQAGALFSSLSPETQLWIKSGAIAVIEAGMRWHEAPIRPQERPSTRVPSITEVIRRGGKR